METKLRRKPGPLATLGRVRVTVYLDEALADWGKQQEGGLSDLMRRLLTNAHDRAEEGSASSYPPKLRASYNHLVDSKLRAGLSPTEEAELEQVRAQINTYDRQGEAWAIREQTALIVDQELADLRRDIEALPRS